MYEIMWVAITLFGDPRLWTLFIIGLTAVHVLLGKRRPVGGKAVKFRRTSKKFLLLLIPALLITFIGSEGLKLLFQIPRPCVPCPAQACNPYCPATFSFPSGHTSTITGIVTAMFLILRKRRYLLLYTAVLLVAVSRVVLGVHTWGDVLGGFVFATSATALIWRYRKKLYRWEDEIL